MDPLELLSDNSLDNDSFFENPTGGSNKPKAKLKGGTNDDLFGIKEESEFDFEYKGVGGSEPAKGITPRINKQKPSQSNDNGNGGEDDDLGFDPKKPKAGSKASIFDDLLSNIETRRPMTAAPAPSTSTTTRPTVSRQSTDTTTDNSNWAANPGSTRPKTSFGGRRSSNTMANADPLGLWTTAGKEKDSNMSSSVLSTPKAKPRATSATTANWLGLTEPSEKKGSMEQHLPTPPPINKPSTPHKDQVDILEISHAEVDREEAPAAFEMAPPTLMPQGSQDTITAQTATAQNIIALNALNTQTANAAISALQQQESQLALAVQMKNQEQALLEMKVKQDAMLQQQERRFNSLLQEQIQRQQQMEQHILQQQNRINAHIQLMMTPQQPPLPTITSSPTSMDAAHHAVHNGGDEAALHRAQATDERIQLEVELKHAQLENSQLESLVQNLKRNYENEVELMERSYKKQLQVLEEHQQAVETRLKAELDNQTTNYEQRLRSLQDERDQLKTTHEEALRKLQKSHTEDFDMLKEDHRRMLDNVREAKLLEFAAVQQNSGYLETLRMASSNLEDLGGSLSGLRDELQLRMDTVQHERESKLAARERSVEAAEKRLQISADAAEQEKRHLMELVSSLELQLAKLTTETADENWVLRQKITALDAEKAAFEREKEFARGQLARDESRLAEQKELHMREAQRVMEELQRERAEFETKQRLHANHNYDSQRLEVEAALKVAQDATRQADDERQRYHKAQRELEQARRQVVDEQCGLRAKQQELEQELCALHLAERKATEAQQHAKQGELIFQKKVQLLQQRMRELAEKEASLSQERMLVTGERIKLHNLRGKLSEQRKCTLCQMAERNEEITQLLAGTMTMEPTAAAAAVAAAAATVGDIEAMGMDNHQRYTTTMMDQQPNVVERLLDESILESFRKMRATNVTGIWNDSVLDDDSKELALHNRDTEPQ